MMVPKFVSPYRMSGIRGKIDAADPDAICETVTRPNRRFVPAKSMEQQSRLFVHRARQGYVEHRIALINGVRGLLSAPVVLSDRVGPTTLTGSKLLPLARACASAMPC